MSTALSWTELRASQPGPRRRCWPSGASGLTRGAADAGCASPALVVAAADGRGGGGAGVPRRRAPAPSAAARSSRCCPRCAWASWSSRSSPPSPRPAGARWSRATRRSRSRSRRRPTTSARCCWRRSTSPGSCRPGRCSGSRPTRSGPNRLWAYELPVLLWIARGHGAGAGGRLARRGSTPRPARHRDLPRPGGRCWPSASVALVVTGRLAPLLDRSPTTRILDTVLDAAGRATGARGSSGVLVLVVIGLAAVVLGALPGALGAAAARCARSCGWSRAATRPGRRPRSDFAMMLRIDRAAVWRSVPLRRGMTGAGPDARRGRARRRPRVADADDPAGPGGLRWRAALRREHLVPRRSRRAVARLPPGLAAGRRSSRAVVVLIEVLLCSALR